MRKNTLQKATFKNKLQMNTKRSIYEEKLITLPQEEEHDSIEVITDLPIGKKKIILLY